MKLTPTTDTLRIDIGLALSAPTTMLAAQLADRIGGPVTFTAAETRKFAGEGKNFVLHIDNEGNMTVEVLVAPPTFNPVFKESA